MRVMREAARVVLGKGPCHLKFVATCGRVPEHSCCHRAALVARVAATVGLGSMCLDCRQHRVLVSCVLAGLWHHLPARRLCAAMCVWHITQVMGVALPLVVSL